MNRISRLAIGISSLMCGSVSAAIPLYDVVVAKDGSGDFTSVQQAIDAAPQNNQQYVIYIRKGIYPERLNITRNNLYLIGEDRDRTIITASFANGTLDANGVRTGTAGSRTVYVNALDFKARTVTIENGFDFNANQAKDANDPTKLRDTQAVALMVAQKADRAQFKDVNLVGYQDTLYLRGGRSVFEESVISGNVDFIFGHGTGLFKSTELVARNRFDVAPGTPYGYITAPSTNIEQPFGLVFKDCRLTKEEGVPADSYGLGRPWHPTTTFADGRYADPNAIGHAAFIDCDMDDHIYGWDKMSGRDIDQQTIWFYPQDSRFWEYESRGPGAALGEQRPQLKTAALSQYSDDKVLSGWQADLSLGQNSELHGEVLHNLMRFPAQVTVRDSAGKQRQTQTDAKGRYQLSIAGMTGPLLVSADDRSGSSCLHSDQVRSVCATALVVDLNNNAVSTGNINPFSDLQVSNLATREGIDGPQHLLELERLPAFSRQIWLETNQQFRQLNGGQDALNSPVSYAPTLHPQMKALADNVVHNRGYNSRTGLANQVALTDAAFQPIINLNAVSQYLVTADQLAMQRQRVQNAETRLFIVGDSTASNYEPDVFPRMGWGQALAEKLSDMPNLAVVNAARSGRSSRDFINGLWLSHLEPMVKAGDYLFIQFGHNDSKCNRAASGRGEVDVLNLCTYPNDTNGQVQFPQGEEALSFQRSLERYIEFALEHNMQPVLLTSVPRVRNDSNRPELPLTTQQHVTRQNSQHGFEFVGSYYQTVLDTARLHQVPVLDIQQRMIEATNQQGDWRHLWLAVDPNDYPYYQGRTGSLDKPDTTHFQQAGAQLVAELVWDEMRAQIASFTENI
ncbi:pectinesterase family protein [Vibrio furnissii]|uniref:pectinesterase family protein n=1 Tax=Vibrio furnissii TaxID=29494 RepID=UPI001EEC7D97|nr:pectinesterase family protein [Vibrio furnissii]